MKISTTLKTLHRTSSAIFEGQVWQNLSLRTRFWFHGLANFRQISRLSGGCGCPSMDRAMEHDPQLLGVVVWPLVDARWPTGRRLQELMLHYKESACIGGMLEIELKETAIMLDLAGVLSSLSLCVERQRWFNREGQLVLSLFHDGNRVYSIAFLLSQENGERVAYVGAIQGVRQPEESDLYKNITKGACGLRPRDLTISLFLVFCEAIQVQRILAVQDRYRQHRHSYFGAAGNPKVFADYDAIWSEQGATLNEDGYYSLLPGVRAKPLESVSSNKRSMYRRRYQFLNESLTALQNVIQDRSTKPGEKNGGTGLTSRLAGLAVYLNDYTNTVQYLC